MPFIILLIIIFNDPVLYYCSYKKIIYLNFAHFLKRIIMFYIKKKRRRRLLLHFFKCIHALS
jgi:hypothetical protein